MRIDHRDAVPGGNVSGKHIPQQCAFPGTRAPKQRQVAASRIRHDVDWLSLMERVFTAANEHWVKGHGSGETEKIIIVRG